MLPFERVGSAAGWIAAVGSALEGASKPLLDAGLHMGWHTHAFEFATTDGDELPLDLILDNATSLSLELDIALAVIGGKDAMESISKYADRLSSVHVKDLAPEGQCKDEDGWADSEKGTVQLLVSNYRKAGLADMIQAIHAGREHRYSLELAIHVVEAMTAIIESGESGSFVQLSTTYDRPAALNAEDAQSLLKTA